MKLMEDNYHNIDQAIRRKFEQFNPEPPEAIWNHIQSRIGNPPPATPIIQIILPVITGLVLIVAFLMVQIIYKPASNLSLQPSHVLQGSLERSGTWLASIQNSPEIPLHVDNQVSLSDLAVDASPLSTRSSAIPVRAPFNLPINGNSLKESKRNEQHSGQVTSSNFRAERHKKTTPQRFETPGKVPGRYAGPVSVITGESQARTIQSRKSNPVPEPEYFSRPKPTLSLGLCLNPEITFYPSGHWEKGTNFSLGFMPALRFDKMFLQTGLNIRMTKDAGKYEIKYNQYLGQYEDVYLVTFDSTENGVIPTYYTETVDVYDTINHYYITPTTARYTYLEIPVLVGYQKSFNRLSWYVKGGPSFSFIASRNIPDANVDGEQSRILNVDRQVPVRANLNWQLMAAVGIDFRFSRHMSFSFEPTLRYFLSPEISSGITSGGRPFGIGMRAGLIYHFKD